MFRCTLKKELIFPLSRLETNHASFSQVKFSVFEAQPVFSKLSEAAPLDERDRISFTSTPSLHYRTVYVHCSAHVLSLVLVKSCAIPKFIARLILYRILLVCFKSSSKKNARLTTAIKSMGDRISNKWRL